MGRTAVYLRVSTDRQSKGLEAQERAVMSHIEKIPSTEYRVFKDENISGSKCSRPQLDLMMSEIRVENFDSIVVYSFSRFARSTKHLLEALDEFNQLGVTFISITENVDTSSPMGRAMFTLTG